MAIEDYKELRVYQSAFDAAMQIFEHTKSWPKHEQYALTDQIRRSSRSVCANICEAWYKRKYPNHFVSKLSDACTEAGETLTWLDFALECESCPTTTSRISGNHTSELSGALST